VLAAAEHIEAAQAVVTIGAPASPEHLLTKLGDALAPVEREGQAEVTVAGRSFRVDQAFVDDLKAQPMTERIRGLRKSLLIMHSPLDTTVDIDEASEIFAAALHPKSFVSLDRADHLLNRSEDAEFVAATIAGWSARYFATDSAIAHEPVAAGHVRIDEGNRRFLCEVRSDDHDWLADEPAKAGGDNLGPDPYEQLLAALGSCTSMTLRMYANRKQWPLDDVSVELSHERDHGPDCRRCEQPGQVIDVIQRRIRIDGNLDASQRRRLLEIADRCPVHKTLTGDLRIETEAAGD
jgi:putative redox protein